MDFSCKAVLGIVLCTAIFRVSPGQELVTNCSSSGYTYGVPGDVLCQLDRSYYTSSCGLPPTRVQFVFFSPAGVQSTYCEVSFSSFSSTGTPEPANCPSCSCSSDATGSEYTLTFTPDSTVHYNGRFECDVDCFLGAGEDHSSCSPIPLPSPPTTSPPDPCENNPCENGGTCVGVSVDYRDFFCWCPKGWIGVNCSKKGDCSENGDLVGIALSSQTAGSNAYRDVDTTNASCACFWTHQEELCVALSDGLIALIVSGTAVIIIFGTGSGVIIYKWNNRPWAKCGDCHSWRRLTMRIPDDAQQKMFNSGQWTCSLNPDEKFNQCDIQQDKGIDAREVMESLQETLEKYKKDKNISDVKPNQLIWLKCNKCKKWRKQKDNQPVLDVRQINKWTCPASICGTKEEPGRKEDLRIRLILLAIPTKISD